MPTRTERKRIRKAQALAKENAEKTKARWSLIGRWIGAPTLVLGTVATVLYFYPQFSLSKELPLDPAQIFTTPFVLRYDGWVPLFDVTVGCDITSVKTANDDFFHDFSVKSYGKHLRIAWHDDAMTFPCQGIQGDIDTVDITIYVNYHAPLLGEFDTRRRYISVRESDRSLRLEEAPTHE